MKPSIPFQPSFDDVTADSWLRLQDLKSATSHGHRPASTQIHCETGLVEESVAIRLGQLESGLMDNRSKKPQRG